MRILHVLDHSIPLHSGYTFRTLAILREQRKMGWETIHLTSPKQGASPADPEPVDGLLFHRTAPRSGGPLDLPVLRELVQMRDVARRLEALARETRPDILHAHSPVLNARPALAVGRRLGIPVVYEVRAFWEDAAVDHGTTTAWGPRYRATRALETDALRRAAAVTTICEGLRGDIVARGIPAERVTVIPNAVDLERFAGASAPDAALAASLGLDGGPVIGFIGSFYHYEGLEVLIAAMPAIVAAMPTARVLLAGGGPEDERLRARAAATPHGDRIRFLGRVPHADIGRYYDLIDVFVYPRLSTRLTDLVTPLKPLEAMAQGRLVAASDVGGHRELVRDGATGVLFRAGDPAALAARVVELLRSPETFPALRREARAFVERERSWPTVVERYRAVYDMARAARP
ncbi:MAG TPA: TIGR04063 family PEP-CTERM/XrtA system glycosyltransferase [Candidatus Eisenbacteria bacterium]|nr:TIGR04063 family PEP-CTERM/XrtA system glycosyltransferase [Candidatus Eisenbacteria bacterium]